MVDDTSQELGYQFGMHHKRFVNTNKQNQKNNNKIIDELLISPTRSNSCLCDFSGCVMDFENGGDKWARQGTAFNNQPTYGDNPTHRGRETAQQQGDWWIGGYEDRPSPSHAAGQTQTDTPQGTMTSPAFTIRGSMLSFLIGGGCDVTKVRAELVVDGKVVRQETGKCFETMVRRQWHVTEFKGKMAHVRLVDQSSGGWGHINFDDLRGNFCL